MAMTASSCVVISLAESRARYYRKMLCYLYHPLRTYVRPYVHYG